MTPHQAHRRPRSSRLPSTVHGQNRGGHTFSPAESCALDAIGATFVRDILPGEVVVVSTRNGVKSYPPALEQVPSSLCVFEHIYFARPDSVIDGASVHEARLRAGAFLALDHPVQADVVIGVPDSGIEAAIGYARQSGIPYGIGFIKNKYIGRTFIQPEQKQRRERRCASSSTPWLPPCADKRVVHGGRLHRSGHHLRPYGGHASGRRGPRKCMCASPRRPSCNPCYFGTDIDSTGQSDCRRITPWRRSARIIGADSIGFLSLEACDKLAVGSHCGFCKACFSGEYPVRASQGRPKAEALKPDLSEKE